MLLGVTEPQKCYQSGICYRISIITHSYRQCGGILKLLDPGRPHGEIQSDLEPGPEAALD